MREPAEPVLQASRALHAPLPRLCAAHVCPPNYIGHSAETMRKYSGYHTKGATERMGTTSLARHRLACTAFCLGAILLQACGGGGSPRRSGAPTLTPTPVSSQSMPSVTPTLAPVHIQQGGNLAAAISSALPGSMFIVPPGSYGPVAFPSDDRGPITVYADVTAQLSPESAPGPVVIDAHDGPVALDISNQSSIVIDGVTVRGATDAGIRVSGSNNITIQNSTVKHNTGDGIRLEDSFGGTVFDNLVFLNNGSGIRNRGYEQCARDQQYRHPEHRPRGFLSAMRAAPRTVSCSRTISSMTTPKLASPSWLRVPRGISISTLADIPAFWLAQTTSRKTTFRVSIRSSDFPTRFREKILAFSYRAGVQRSTPEIRARISISSTSFRGLPAPALRAATGSRRSMASLMISPLTLASITPISSCPSRQRPRCQPTRG